MLALSNYSVKSHLDTFIYYFFCLNHIAELNKATVKQHKKGISANRPNLDDSSESLDSKSFYPYLFPLLDRRATVSIWHDCSILMFPY